MPELPTIPIADWIDRSVDWLTDNLTGLFNFISDVIGWLVENLETVLQWPPPVVMAVLLAALAWWLRGWRFGLFTLLALTLIEAMQTPGLWDATMSTLALVLVASGVAVVIGLPIGVAAARSPAVSLIVRPILDFMQTMPAFVYLIPAITFFGIGRVPGVVATLVFAMPPAVRLTELGIRQVDQEVVEAGEAFGAPGMMILRKIQIPLALPTIMAGVNQVIMLSLSMVVIAGIVGAGGLGALVFRGITRLNVGLGFEAGLAVVIVAIFLDRVTSALSDRATVQEAD